MNVNATSQSPAAPARVTHAESAAMLVLGFLKVWFVVGVGAAAGYGLAFLVGPPLSLAVQPLSWERLLSRGPLGVLGHFSLLGPLIEVLRVQGGPADGRWLFRWRGARRLRPWMLVCVGAAAVGVGLFGGLWWS